MSSATTSVSRRHVRRGTLLRGNAHFHRQGWRGGIRRHSGAAGILLQRLGFQKLTKVTMRFKKGLASNFEKSRPAVGFAATVVTFVTSIQTGFWENAGPYVTIVPNARTCHFRVKAPSIPHQRPRLRRTA